MKGLDWLSPRMLLLQECVASYLDEWVPLMSFLRDRVVTTEA